MDPTSKPRSATAGMSALVRRVLGAGPRLKKRSKRVSAAEEEAEDYFSSKSKGSSSSSSSSSTDHDSREMDSETESENVLRIKEKKRPRRRSSTFRRQRSYQMWVGTGPRLAFSCLRIRIVQMMRLMKTMAFLRRLRNAYRRLMHAAGSSKAVLSLTDLYYAVADLIPRANEEKCPPPANNIIVLRPIMLQSSQKRNLSLSLRNRADIKALRETLNLQAAGSRALIRTNALVS